MQVSPQMTITVPYDNGNDNWWLHSLFGFLCYVSKVNKSLPVHNIVQNQFLPHCANWISTMAFYWSRYHQSCTFCCCIWKHFERALLFVNEPSKSKCLVLLKKKEEKTWFFTSFLLSLNFSAVFYKVLNL